MKSTTINGWQKKNNNQTTAYELFANSKIYINTANIKKQQQHYWKANYISVYA